MKEQILELRKQGKTYDEIQRILNCSKGTISYHCGLGQKENNLNRQRKRRSKLHPYSSKIEDFFRVKQRKSFIPKTTTFLQKQLREKIYKFQKRDNPNMKQTFDFNDVIDKFTEKPKCYLTGDDIDIYQPSSYQFDHIIPKSRGGSDTLDNLGITTKQANLAKGNMTPDELIFFCKKVLENNGYQISK